jgi:UDP-N-acetylglucosamine transferase subunit ALG13
MRILVTVGTTKFDSLISYIDTEPCFDNLSIEFQIANGRYIPQKHPYFVFLDSAEIIKKYQEADIIITHAGQGTVFTLLEMRKKFIVVPNLERIDKHQTDIADFLLKNKYALVAYRMAQLELFIDIIQSYNFRNFNKEAFFKSDEIINFLSIER